MRLIDLGFGNKYLDKRVYDLRFVLSRFYLLVYETNKGVVLVCPFVCACVFAIASN